MIGEQKPYIPSVEETVSNEEKEIKHEQMERIFNEAVKYTQESYVSDSKGSPAMLLGDVAELIKMVTGKEVDIDTLAKYTEGN